MEYNEVHVKKAKKSKEMQNNKNGFSDNEVLDIELELTGICNLHCPLCANQYAFNSHIKGKNIRPLSEWTKQLNKYSNLKSVCLAGILSEPTLYPDLFDLLEYFHKRCISIELYTNGSTHNEAWWNMLNAHMTENDKVFFTVCGSTQELHEKYRVGSNLQQMLKNAMAFRKNNPYNNDWIQHIKFNYNAEDFDKNMKCIIQQFSHSFLINSLPYNERFLKAGQCDICMPGNLPKRYTCIMKDAMSRREKHMPFNICCKSLETKFIAIDQFGNVFPCFLYRFYAHKKFSTSDYSDILAYKYDFCYECEEHTKRLLEMNNMERMA